MVGGTRSDVGSKRAAALPRASNVMELTTVPRLTERKRSTFVIARNGIDEDENGKAKTTEILYTTRHGWNRCRGDQKSIFSTLSIALSRLKEPDTASLYDVQRYSLQWRSAQNLSASTRVCSS